MNNVLPSSMLGAQAVIRKSSCRYGRGCTHINDPAHLERFCHPLKQELNGIISLKGSLSLTIKNIVCLSVTSNDRPHGHTTNNSYYCVL